MEQAIVALSTPIGRGAIAIVRLSGSNCIDIVASCFSPMPTAPNTMRVGNFDAVHFVDQCMCVYFVAPHSYTGEDMVEIHCHGGIAVVNGIIDACISKGARMAYNGEFSKRAFVNGKQNLTNAEGIIDMIEADTVSQAKTASGLMSNVLGRKVISLQDNLTDIISSCEVALDYPEEDIELPTIDSVAHQAQDILVQIDKLLDTVDTGKIIKYGIDVAIVGAPNVGKSSLLNCILGNDRAIVTDIAGTTRDTITDSIIYRGIKLNFADTAGIHDTTDKIEALGIDRTLQVMDNADVVLYVVDNTSNYKVLDTKCPVITIYNKCDSYDTSNIDINAIPTSAINGTNIDAIKERIYNMFATSQLNSNDTILTNSRHIGCLKRAKESLLAVMEHNTTLDCVVTHLRECWDSLGAITGTVATEEIIDRIYSKFCLGK